ncbi:hypothetical protein [Halobacillus sp. H74]|uniref:hypothetical protein n=1 Tax=Halobacillus sp. H74 TaxID=3457436 RepID=UPI003FCED628
MSNSGNVSQKGTMEGYVKTLTEKRFSNDGKDVLLDQLNEVCKVLVLRAEEHCLSSGRSTIFKEDLHKAYEELMKPHVFVEEITLKLENQKTELQELAEKSITRFLEDV